MNSSKQLQELEQKCSRHWLQQIKEAITKDDFNGIEYSSFALLRFFRCLNESEIKTAIIDDFYYQIINFIKNTETINVMNETKDIYFFRSVSHLLISDFYRGFNEISKISFDTVNENDRNDDLIQVEKSSIIYIKFACLSFFKRYDDALSIMHEINNGQSQLYDGRMFIDTQIRQSLILSKLNKNEESIKLLTGIKSHQNINTFSFFSLRDIDFQIGSIYCINYITKNDDLFKIGFDILMKLASLNPSIVFFQIAYCYAFNGQYDRARAYVLQIEQSSQSYSIKLFFSFVLYKLNALSESYEILRDLLKYSQFSSSVCELIGLIFLKCGKYNKATQFLQNAYALDENCKTYILNYGLSLEIQEKTRDMAEQFYKKVMLKSYQWETYADRSCILNLNENNTNEKYFLQISEPSLEEIILSPAQEQIERFLQAPPFLPSHFFSSLKDVRCDEVPISPLQKRISLFPIESL